MVYEYLCRLSQVAQGPLPTREWARLVEQIRRCIAAQRQPGARDDVDRVQRILRRMGDPDLIVGEAVRRLDPLVPAAGPPAVEAEPGLLNRLGACRRELFALLALTGGTLLALTAGTPLLAHVGLVVGGVLVGTSGLWAVRDKLLTMLTVPLVTLLGGVVLSWLQATRLGPDAQIGDRLERAAEWLWATFFALPLVIGWTVALYLGFRLMRALRD